MEITPDTANLLLHGFSSEIIVSSPVAVKFTHASSNSVKSSDSGMVSVSAYPNAAEVALPSINSGNIDISL